MLLDERRAPARRSSHLKTAEGSRPWIGADRRGADPWQLVERMKAVRYAIIQP
jgi:hypothetical protein